MQNTCLERSLSPAVSAPPHPVRPPRGGALRGDEQGRLKHARELFWHYWLPLLAMLTLIKLESTDAMSGQHTGSLLRRLMLWLGVRLQGEPLDLLNLVLRKSGHMLGYGLLCVCWLLLLRGTYWFRHEYQLALKGGIGVRRLWWRPEWGTLAVLFTFLVAAADELHQMGIPSRTGCWSDVGLDSTAALIAATLIYAQARWRGRLTPVIERGR